MPAGVAESPIRLEGRVRAIHQIDGPDSRLRALEVPVLRTWVDESLLMAGHSRYIDPLRWNPLFMKFTEYFTWATLARPSSLARGWDMPPLPAPAFADATQARAGEAVPATAS